MTPWPTQHLTADDLDAFHSGALSRELELHLETCEDCQRLAIVDREVVAGLSRLPALEPRAGFVERVMARVAVGEPAALPVFSFPKLTRRRVAALSALAAGVVISAAWSATNRVLLDAWLATIRATLVDGGWALFRAFTATMAEQPWSESIRQAAGTPGRILIFTVATLVMYASGLVALRRLITPSTAPAPAPAPKSSDSAGLVI